MIAIIGDATDLEVRACVREYRLKRGKPPPTDSIVRMTPQSFEAACRAFLQGKGFSPASGIIPLEVVFKTDATPKIVVIGGVEAGKAFDAFEHQIIWRSDSLVAKRGENGELFVD